MLPARGSLSPDYAAALAQRNAGLKRGDRDALAPWTAQLASIGAELVAARAECLALLAAPFAESAGALGLPESRLAYEGDPPTVEALEARLDRDLERGATGLGPHLHDVSISSAGRDLRSFGSQGEQRTAVLALLLAEATLLPERREEPPLLLLDDVLSELDPTRRRVLVEQVEGRGQTLITATTADALPGEPAQLLQVTPGRGDVERLDREIRGELSRFGPQGGMPELLAAWPDAVGPMVAANAWPARIARDGTLHVNTSSSTWAFELGQLAPTILEELRRRSAKVCRKR